MIASERLELIALTPVFYRASLQQDRTTAEALLGLRIAPEWFEQRDLMQMRLRQLEHDIALQPWLLRAIALRSEKRMVGHIGFHDRPNAAYLRDVAPGAAEFGYTVFASDRRQGYAREASEALMRWAQSEHRVTRFVVSIRPDNMPSRRLAAHFNFQRIGSQIDEIDGLEDIYELRTDE